MGQVLSGVKIMLFSHICSSSFITGAEKYLLMLTSELNRRFGCTLVVPAEGVLLQEAKQRGLRTIVQPIPLVWSLLKPEENVVQELKDNIRRHAHSEIVNLLHIEQPDLVIVNTVVNPMPAAAAKALGIPVAWLITETMAGQTGKLQAVRWIDRYTDWIIGISDSALQPFRKEGLNGKLTLLPPTWQEEKVQPEQWPYYRQLKRSELGIEQDKRVIGYISSSLYPEKGLEHFVQMALEVCAQVPDAMFLIVGNAAHQEYVERCERRIQESGYAGRFHRLAFEPNMEKLYPAMDFIVIPNLIEEDFEMTALEGLVFGKQVIAYRTGGLEEILRTTGHASGLVEKGDAAALTLKMLQKLSSEQQLQISRQEAEEAFGYAAYNRRLSRLCFRFQSKCSRRLAELNASPMPSLLMNMVYKSDAASVVFLLENGVKRPFASSDAFQYYKYRWSDIQRVTDPMLHRYPTSAPISRMAPFHHHRPSIMLAKGSGATVYLLVNNRRYPFVSVLSIKQRGYDLNRTVMVPDEELGRLELGSPLEELASGMHRTRRRRKKRLKAPKGNGLRRIVKRRRQSLPKKRRGRKE